MAFAALDLRARIVATIASHSRCFDALPVYNGEAGIWGTPIARAQQATQVSMHALKGAVIGPFAEIVIHRAIIGQIFGQYIPLTTRFVDIDEGIHHTAHTNGAR
jgi:hypothetical protein